MILSPAIPGKMSEALALFSEMQKKGIKPGMVGFMFFTQTVHKVLSSGLTYMSYFLNLTMGENKSNNGYS